MALTDPVNLHRALGSFHDVCGPRIVAGGSISMFEPPGISTTGDLLGGPIPANVDSTTGHER